jgi:hypothetical protein
MKCGEPRGKDLRTMACKRLKKQMKESAIPVENISHSEKLSSTY